MALAINIRSDNDSAGEIVRLWHQVAVFEAEPSMRALGYRPHFTFAIYDSPAAHEQAACDAMLAASSGERQLRIRFKRIRWFEASPLVLWAEPEANESLARIHGIISAAIDPAHCRPHYRPGAWTPHCTLGTAIADERRDDAMDFAHAFDRNIEVLFDVVDCVAFPPVRIIAERKLPL
ncbi:2'-5' RNA ligase family protein [Bradyrhizobium sp. CAR08]